MTMVDILKIEKAGADYILLRSSASEVRVNFADDETFSKEDSAAFRLELRSSPVTPLASSLRFGIDSVTEANLNEYSGSNQT